MKSYSGISQQAQQQMRASMTKQQAKSSTGKHDGRNNGQGFEESQHIDPDRLENDVFWTWLDTEDYSCGNFDEAMLKFYTATYSDTLKRINDNYVKDRHPEKQKSMEEYLANHMPESFILQIGNCMDNVDADTLAECVNEYFAWEQQWNEEHGYPFEILTMALHDDEATPHVHCTRAWRAVDKHGNVIPNREKALEQVGVELPNPDKKVSRYNNRNVTFTAMCRDKWLDICEEHGFDIIREPIKDVKAKNKGDFIREREKAMLEREEAVKSQERANLEAELRNIQEAYAIGSVSLVQAEETQNLRIAFEALDKERVGLNDFAHRLNAKRDELVSREQAIKDADASVIYEIFKKYDVNGKPFREFVKEKAPEARASLEAQARSLDDAYAELRRKYPSLYQDIMRNTQQSKSQARDFGMDM